MEPNLVLNSNGEGADDTERKRKKERADILTWINGALLIKDRSVLIYTFGDRLHL